MIIGWFLVRPIPLPDEEGYEVVQPEEDPDAITTALIPDSSSHTNLLDHDFVETAHPRYIHRGDNPGQEDNDTREVELSPPHLGVGQGGPEMSNRLRSLSRGAAIAHDTTPNLHGRKLWVSGDFWLLFSILSMRAYIALFLSIGNADDTSERNRVDVYECYTHCHANGILIYS